MEPYPTCFHLRLGCAYLTFFWPQLLTCASHHENPLNSDHNLQFSQLKVDKDVVGFQLVG